MGPRARCCTERNSRVGLRVDPLFTHVHMNPTHNETRRLVVELRTFAKEHRDLKPYPLADETTIFLVEDEDMADGQSTWKLVAPPAWAYSNIDALCHDRACRVEAGTLLLDGKQVRAETYLAAWRTAADRAMPLFELETMGLTLIATLPVPRGHCESAQDDEATALRRHLTSPHIVRQDQERVVWDVPLTDVASVMLCNDLLRAYWSRERYPGAFEREWRVVSTGSVAAGELALPALAPDPEYVLPQIDLFDVEVV